MRFFPYPITIGFTTGIGVTLFIGQIKDFCGFENVKGTEAIEKIISYFENITTFDLATFFVGAIGLACVIVIPKINKKIPSALVAIILCTVVTLCLNSFAGTEIATIGSRYGEIKAGFFPIDFSSIGNVKFSSLIVPAIVIAFLCAIESLLSATVASGMTNTTFDANQELVGQGVANIFSSLLGGLPATGAIARTAAGIENKAKSPLAGMFHAIFVLILYFALMDVVKYIPLAVFSAILMSVAINMSRFRLFAKLSRFGVRDVIILAVTCALTIIFDLTYGVIAGVIVTFALNIKNIRTGLKLEKDENAEGVVIKAKGTLFFLNANKLTDMLAREFENASEVTVDMSALERVDETALEKIVALNRKIKAQGKSLELVNYNDRIRARLDKFFKVL